MEIQGRKQQGVSGEKTIKVTEKTLEKGTKLEGVFRGKAGTHEISHQELADRKKELLDKYKKAEKKGLATKTGSEDILSKRQAKELTAKGQVSEKQKEIIGKAVPKGAEIIGLGKDLQFLEGVETEAKGLREEVERDIKEMTDIIKAQKTLGPSADAAVKLNNAVNEYKSAISELIKAQKAAEGEAIRLEEGEKELEAGAQGLDEFEILGAQKKPMTQAQKLMFPGDAEKVVETKRKEVEEALSEVYEGLDLHIMKDAIIDWKKELAKLKEMPESKFPEIEDARQIAIGKLTKQITQTQNQMEVLLKYGTTIDLIGTDLSKKDIQKAEEKDRMIAQIAKEGISNEQIQYIRQKIDLPKIDSKLTNSEKEAGDAVLKTMTALKEVDDLLTGKKGLENFKASNIITMHRCRIACWASAALMLLGVGFILLPIAGILSYVASYKQEDAKQMLGKIDAALEALNKDLIHMEKAMEPVYFRSEYESL